MLGLREDQVWISQKMHHCWSDYEIIGLTRAQREREREMEAEDDEEEEVNKEEQYIFWLKKDGEQSGRRRGREVDNEVESRLADMQSSEHQERGKNELYAGGG